MQHPWLSEQAAHHHRQDLSVAAEAGQRGAALRPERLRRHETRSHLIAAFITSLHRMHLASGNR